ncbi:hypothetical protein VHP8226_02590 [Vibrio hippocampi]|uniref:Uncharacterized protein n=1 Tax=Vibrio hippocampi TaxID=654686 RepID=A0ABM8ZKE2_9VIBR|nr:hypothetical protein VHP8226_02590 [Vibrio hippocampi]
MLGARLTQKLSSPNRLRLPKKLCLPQDLRLPSGGWGLLEASVRFNKIPFYKGMTGMERNDGVGRMIGVLTILFVLKG